MTRPRLRLKKSEFQWRDWAIDTETPSRLSLYSAISSWSNLVRFLLFGFFLPNESTRLWYFVDIETETHRDWKIYWVSRPRLIETEQFLGCQDRDSSRLRNFLDVKTETHQNLKISWMLRLRNLMDVETETSRDRAKDVDTETPSRLSLISELSPSLSSFFVCWLLHSGIMCADFPLAVS